MTLAGSLGQFYVQRKSGKKDEKQRNVVRLYAQLHGLRIEFTSALYHQMDAHIAFLSFSYSQVDEAQKKSLEERADALVLKVAEVRARLFQCLGEIAVVMDLHETIFGMMDNFSKVREQPYTYPSGNPALWRAGALQKAREFIDKNFESDLYALVGALSTRIEN